VVLTDEYISTFCCIEGLTSPSESLLMLHDTFGRSAGFFRDAVFDVQEPLAPTQCRQRILFVLSNNGMQGTNIPALHL